MGWELAQINVARFLEPRDSPANADFMAALDHVNAMADAAPGFVWRLVGDGSDATDLLPDASDPRRRGAERFRLSPARSSRGHAAAAGLV